MIFICSSIVILLGVMIVGLIMLVIYQYSQDKSTTQKTPLDEMNRIVDESFGEIHHESNRYLSEIQTALKGE